MRARLPTLALIFGMASGSSAVVGQECVSVEPHNWRSEMKLGFAYIFDPKLALEAEVFHIYSNESVSGLFESDGSQLSEQDGYADGSEGPSLMVSWVNPDTEHALILSEAASRVVANGHEMLHGTWDGTLGGSEATQFSEWPVYWAAQEKLEGTNVVPDYTLIHWPGEHSIQTTEWGELYEEFCSAPE